MSWLDFAVLGVALISILWGVWHGLVREVISLAGWVIAFLAANLLAAPVGGALPGSIPNPELRLVLAFVGVFVIALVLAAFASNVLARAVKAAGLVRLDRVLGGLFGTARAVLIAVAFALVAGLTPLPRGEGWRHSVTGRPLEHLALAAKPWLPPSLAARLRYH